MWAIASTRGRQRRLEWSFLAVALLGLVAWLSTSSSLDRVNHLVQDAGLRLISRPAHPDIVIVAIDDRSIAAIGRWPWRRALHAELISRVSAQDPRAIGVDVLFSEEELDYPEDDLLLASAMARSGRVVLPLLRRSHGPAGSLADLPLPALAQAAARLGHVHVAPDDDGVVRFAVRVQSPDGAETLTYDGLRCETREHKRYAIGADNKTWAPSRSSQWRRLESGQAVLRALEEFYLCVDRSPVASVNEAIRRMKQR